MDALAEIEGRHQFTLPKAYRAFVERGYLTYPGSSYLQVHEAEWIPPAEVADYEWPSYTKPKPGLVPFAFTGTGDRWCWQTDRITPLGEPAVVYCPHDSYDGHWHAPSFIGWLYRVSLEYCSSLWGDEEETKENVRLWAGPIQEFGDPAWYAELQELLARSPFTYEWGPRRMKETGLLTFEEVDARIRRAFGDEYVKAPYIWDLDGEPNAG